MNVKAFDSLVTKSSKSIVSSLGNDAKAILLRELINEKSRKDKKALYRELGELVYGGVRLSGKYTYAIFTVCNINQFIMSDNYIYAIYAHLDESWRGDHFQIMFIRDGMTNDRENVKFDCGRATSKKSSSPLITRDDPTNLFRSKFIEYPEARQVYEILSAKGLKSGYNVVEASIVVRLRADILIDDNLPHSFRPIDHGDKSDIDLFSDAIQNSAHCEEFDPKEYHEELEFTIVVNDMKCQVILRQFECPGADGG
jgi:hypothetical protein